ncbi:MAG: ATP synthase F1 subunit delta [Candidatus Falkowbacteria bacterium]
MKIKPKQYAETLLALTRNKDRQEAIKVISKLAGLIVRRNQSSQLDKIIESFEKAWNKEDGLVAVEIISARELDKSSRKLILDYVNKNIRGRKTEVKYGIDSALKGGFVVRYGSTMLDFSLRNRLKELKQSLAK